MRQRGQDLNVGVEIVATMRAHQSDADVQESALWNLAVDERNKQILGQDLSVGSEIVAPTRAHQAHAGVQENACGASSNLAANFHSRPVPM